MTYESKAQRAARVARGGVTQRPTISEVLESKASMLNPKALPVGYGAIETGAEALAAVLPDPPQITLRLHIVWDCPATELQDTLPQVLDTMRGPGAAMVRRVEEVR